MESAATLVEGRQRRLSVELGRASLSDIARHYPEGPAQAALVYEGGVVILTVGVTSEEVYSEARSPFVTFEEYAHGTGTAGLPLLERRGLLQSHSGAAGLLLLQWVPLEEEAAGVQERSVSDPLADEFISRVRRIPGVVSVYGKFNDITHLWTVAMKDDEALREQVYEVEGQMYDAFEGRKIDFYVLTLTRLGGRQVGEVMPTGFKRLYP